MKSNKSTFKDKNNASIFIKMKDDIYHFLIDLDQKKEIISKIP